MEMEGEIKEINSVSGGGVKENTPENEYKSEYFRIDIKKKREIKIWNYGQYSTDNYGSSIAVKIGDLILYFSYKTVIAFEDGCNLVVCKNVWSNTTGKHLNWIDGGGKKGRVDYETFKKLLDEALDKHGFHL